jgi:hypothetical protein
LIPLKRFHFFPIQLIHADVWTSPVMSFSGYKYYLVLLDDYTHYVWIFTMRQKSEVLPLLRDFHAYIGTQFGLRLLALQTDNGKEFDSTALCFFLSAHGVALRLSCPYTSEQNGKVEQTLRTLNDCLRTLLIHSGVSTSFWAEALSTATRLVNRWPCHFTTAKMLFELLFGIPPTYDELCVFGSLCFPNTMATTTHKLMPRSVPCAFIGYTTDHRGYRCYDLTTGRIYTSRHVVFDKQRFPFRAAAIAASAPSSPPPPLVEDEGPTSVPLPPASSGR